MDEIEKYRDDESSLDEDIEDQKISLFESMAVSTTQIEVEPPKVEENNNNLNKIEEVESEESEEREDQSESDEFEGFDNIHETTDYLL